MHFLFLILLSLLLSSCSVPNLTDPTVMIEARSSAVELNTLKRKFMYGMFFLYVEGGDSPYTGWVKRSGTQGQLLEIGYLIDGRKEGYWIKWDSNGSKLSEIQWHEDRLDGIYMSWHPNGQLMAEGQTKEGEMDGDWKEYYPNGQLANRAINQSGHLVEIQVWKPNGTLCEKSSVRAGDGSFYKYKSNGTIEKFRRFSQGIETESKVY